MDDVALKEASKPNVYAALSQVQHEVKAPKDAFNGFGNYNYRSAEGILRIAKPACEKHGLVLTLSEETTLVADWHYIQSTATVTLIADPTQRVEVKTSAREAATRTGMDAAQITGGAVSYARKYALCGLFAIDDSKGEDPDTAKCAVCGKPIVDADVGGRHYEAKHLASGSLKKYGQQLCARCFGVRLKAAKAGQAEETMK